MGKYLPTLDLFDTMAVAELCQATSQTFGIITMYPKKCVHRT